MQKFRQKVYFRGPVYFKNISGIDISFLDDQTLNFGSSNDVSVEWDTAGTPDSLIVLPAAAGNQITLGSSTYNLDIVAAINDLDVDLYGTNPDININRNLAAAATNAPVVYIRQQHATDDQVALQVIQTGLNIAAIDVDGALDIDNNSTNYVSGSLVDINRNLSNASTDAPVVYIRQQHATDNQPALQVVSAGTGAGINLDGALDIDGQSAFTSGSLVDIQRNLANSATDAAVVYIKQDHASDDQVALQVVQDGLNVAAIDIDGAVDIDGVSGYTSGTLVNINRNLSNAQTDDVVCYIRQQHATDNQAALQVISAGTGVAINSDGPVDIDHGTTVTTGSTLDVNRNLGATNTNQAVAYIKQDSSTDDQACLTLINDATNYLTLDAQGWVNAGYTTTQNTQTGVPTGACRVVNVNSKWFWQVHTGSGTYKYLEISSSTTA